MLKKTVFIFSLLFLFSSVSPVLAAELPSPVRIAVIDTGIAVNHPMLDSAHIVPGKNYIFPKDDTNDLIGHGTRVAGLILGSTDGTVEGIAPDAILVPLVYYSRYPSGVPRNGGVEAICQAIYDAIDIFDCQVINLSSGLPEPDEKLYEAVCYAEQKGVIVVSAVGNDNLFAPSRVYYPAAYDTVIGVGAANQDLTAPADFSQQSEGVFLLAPGENLKVLSIKSGDNFETVNGTSYASAQVAGAAAMVKASFPDITPLDFRRILRLSCTDVEEPGYDAAAGWGLLNPNAALREAEGLTRFLKLRLMHVRRFIRPVNLLNTN